MFNGSGIPNTHTQIALEHLYIYESLYVHG